MIITDVVDVIERRNSPYVNNDHLQNINKYCESIKLIFSSLDDGEISSSAYDTARVALIENVNDPTSGTNDFSKSHGMKFLKDNMSKLENGSEDNMTMGFELAFPSLIELSRKLNINVPSDDEYPVLKTIYAKQDVTLAQSVI
ncbi:(-)-kolavenyl diphosphate synthase TPS28, chloroplastic-like [Rutidosis leptorrhynchoides]|uniref:(-)-kolavenyl diphosphate synthase TPS28, chloroplastic-like n=1 Tax=Rutidosis leptorrhynchoides TaxID=125765 RepID=UPI003A9A379C